ncbi:MAG: DUF1853 family protein [Flavobacteriales bacterium]|nr:DUF1853 family protein [Flavobacteriales bacterium]
MKNEQRPSHNDSKPPIIRLLHFPANTERKVQTDAQAVEGNTTSTFAIMELSNIHVRRMHWAIFSPSLLSYPFSTEYVRDEEHAVALGELLLQLDRKPEEVDAYFNSLGKMPMGKYFEQLLFYVLERDERFEVLLKNHQLKKGKHTVGEIDLILKDVQTGAIEHWEIALKYYLQQSCSAEHAVMLGPNAIDNLAKKMRKLIEKQLPLNTDLSEFGIPTNELLTNRLFIKGQFFYHLAHADGCNIFPNHAHPDHKRGWWCYLKEADKMLTQDLLWTTAWKPTWIGEVEFYNNDNLLNFKEMRDLLKRHFQEEVHSVLCVGLQQNDGGWKEVTRGFVVNDDWPNGIKKN